MASSLYATTSSDSGSGRRTEHDGAGTKTLTQKPPGHREPERNKPCQTRFSAERLAHSRLGGRLTIWSSMLVETPLKYESRRIQPEARPGPPLLSRHSCASAKRSGRRPLPDRRFLMEALIWAILPFSPRRAATPFDQRVGSDDRPVLERRFAGDACVEGSLEPIPRSVSTQPPIRCGSRRRSRTRTRRSPRRIAPE